MPGSQVRREQRTRRASSAPTPRRKLSSPDLTTATAWSHARCSWVDVCGQLVLSGVRAAFVFLRLVVFVLAVVVVLVAHGLVHHLQHRPAAAAAEVAPDEQRGEGEEDHVEVAGVVPADVRHLDLRIARGALKPELLEE